LDKIKGFQRKGRELDAGGIALLELSPPPNLLVEGEAGNGHNKLLPSMTDASLPDRSQVGSFVEKFPIESKWVLISSWLLENSEREATGL
jgi:hypothetical protein